MIDGSAACGPGCQFGCCRPLEGAKVLREEAIGHWSGVCGVSCAPLPLLCAELLLEEAGSGHRREWC